MLFSKCLLVLNLCDPEHPGASVGVAFVINKDVITPDDYTLTELIPGRAIVLSIHWRGESRLMLLNVYGPTMGSDTVRAAFWTNLMLKWRAAALPLPDFMLGDYNLIEEAIDHAPAPRSHEAAITALTTFKNTHHLHDTWCNTHPTAHLFTFRSHVFIHGTYMSGLDRIYASQMQSENLFEWGCHQLGRLTDHSMITVRFALFDAPLTGKGCWTLPLHLVNNKRLISSLIMQGIALAADLHDLQDARTPDKNPQTLWTAFKSNIMTFSQTYAMNNRDDFDTNKDARASKALLQQEIDHLEVKKHTQECEKLKAQWHIKGEQVNKYWMAINKETKPCDQIKCLRIPGDAVPPCYETNSKHMAALAGTYHHDLQDQGHITPPDGLTPTENV
ncbi:hypothetical protein EWM64_g4667 [Hericium alpestre]|uniref:Endonuclease/exonuclease/phosphatase domain-containing protein n=1 Tax=Hericium alpestre TaxID=135208 RepID=A0A4Z0A0N3_9AGAM|nr:hypothetical protein EWM64_g4667 [Hericium alpestre]